MTYGKIFDIGKKQTNQYCDRTIGSKSVNNPDCGNLKKAIWHISTSSLSIPGKSSKSNTELTHPGSKSSIYSQTSQKSCSSCKGIWNDKRSLIQRYNNPCFRELSQQRRKEWLKKAIGKLYNWFTVMIV